MRAEFFTVKNFFNVVSFESLDILFSTVAVLSRFNKKQKF